LKFLFGISQLSKSNFEIQSHEMFLITKNVVGHITKKIFLIKITKYCFGKSLSTPQNTPHIPLTMLSYPPLRHSSRCLHNNTLTSLYGFTVYSRVHDCKAWESLWSG